MSEQQQQPTVTYLDKQNVFLIENVLTREECAELIKTSLDKGYNAIPRTGGKQKSWCGIEATEVRKNERVSIQDRQISDMIYQRINKFIPKDLTFRARDLNLTGDYLDSKLQGKEWKCSGVCEQLRFVKYEKNDQFLRHMDGTYLRSGCVVADKKSEPQYFKEQSFLSLILYLNDDFDGGDTVFFDNNTKEERFRVSPKTGSVLLALHENLHEGATIKRGIKFILRTDVLYRKQQQTPTEKSIPKKWTQVDKEYLEDWQKIYHPSCKNYTD